MPAGLIGRGLNVVSAAGTRTAIRTYISKGTLKSIQEVGRRVGLKILQRTLIKYAVPIASAGIGGTYNYISTQSIGRIARSHLKNRFKVGAELRDLVSRQNTYDIVFPAVLMYMARVDGEVSRTERELYRAMLSRMTFDRHSASEFKKLLSNEESILHAVSQIRDDEMKQSLLSLLSMMATCDGRLIEKRLDFLEKVAKLLQIEIDFAKLEERTKAKGAAQGNTVQKTVGAIGDLAAGFTGVVSQTAGNIHISAKEISKGVTRRIRREPRFDE